MFVHEQHYTNTDSQSKSSSSFSGEYFQKLFGNNSSNHFGKGIAYNNFYYIIGGNSGMATLTKLSNTGDHIWTSEVNGTSGWNDIIVNTDGNILLVGIYGAFDGMAESMIGVANGNSGAFISLKSYDFNVRESLTKIYLNPNPASTLYPYRVAGIQNLASGGVDDVSIMTIDKNGNVGTRNLLDSNDDEFYRDISSDGNNGEIILTGNRAALTNNGVTVTLDKNGQVLSGRLFNVNTTFNSILTKQNLFSGNNHILAGRNNTSSIAQIVKVNGNSLVFSHNITQLNTITRLYPIGLSNFIAIGYGTFSGVNRPVMVHMTDSGNSLTINWAKTFNDGENQYGFGFGNLISPNKYIYTDARNGNSDGFGDLDAFISIDSISLDNCIDQPVNVSLSNVTVSFSAFNPTSSTIESISSVNRTAALISYNAADICAETCEVNFTTSNPSCGRVVFTSSTNLSGPVTYNWTFGTVPTSSSNMANPSHIYTNNGTYSVCLTVSNGISNCQICKNVSVNNSDNTPPLINCPQNIFLSTNPGQCFATYTPPVVITDNCDSELICNCMMAGATTGIWIKNTNGSFNVGNTIISCTATDDAGNSSACSFNISVFDSQPPVIQCPPDITLSCTTNPDLLEPGTATATDNCPEVSLSFSDMTTGNNCNRIINRTWRATDQSGSIVSCVQRISFVDNKPPDMVCPLDVTISCSGSALPEATGYATAMDSCQTNVTISFKDAVSGPTCNQIIRRIWTTSDPCGNQSQCLQTITKTDDVPPEIFCPADMTLNCLADNSPMSAGTALAIDHCQSILNVTFSDAQTGSECERFINRTWSATDSCDNTALCVQIIQLTEDIYLEMVCPMDITIDCNDGSEPVNTGTALVTGNCTGEKNISFNDVTTDNTCRQTITRKWTATDGCGNTSVCIQTITKQDNTAPIITCPANVTIDCNGSSLPAITGVATALDNCQSIVQISHQDNRSGTDCDSIITRTWTATDGCGNTSACIQTITKWDNNLPVITCPANVTIDCNGSTLPAITGVATALDNCQSIVQISHQDNRSGTACDSIISRTWTATDGCGNSSVCIQTITKQDNTAPIITCPANVTIDCNASSLPNSTGMATATDNCQNSVQISHQDLKSGTTCDSIITRTWTATDGCGNTSTCVQSIRKRDTTPPSITCPANVTISCNSSSLPTNTGTATATDNCQSNVPVSYSDVKSGTSCDSIITRTWVASDGCGNTSTCVQNIRKRDTTPPIIICPANVTISCNSSSLPTSTGTATATDNCQSNVPVSYSDVKSGTSCDSVIIRTWVASDGCGNTSSCVQNIRKRDTTPPIITCPAYVTINCSTSSLPTITGTATATDNCQSNVQVNYSDVKSGTSCDSTITRTWTASDGCGNTSTCVQTIRKLDNTAPIINCPANVTLDCNSSTLPGITGTATATGDCQINLILTFTDIKTGTFCDSTIVRTWSVSDVCGQSASCQQFIYKKENVALTMVCSSNKTQDCTMSADTTFTGVPLVTGNCPGNITISFIDLKSGAGCDSTITRNWKAVDACGNTAGCTQTIQISGLPPVFSDCGRKYVMDGQKGLNGCGADIIVQTPEKSNPCGSAITLTNNINNTGDATGYYASGITYVQWEATTLCGLRSFCQDTVMVTPCDTMSCCTPTSVFDQLITTGFTFVTDECSVTVRTTQFNDCHYFTSYPDFSDGSVVLNDTIPANGSWTYTFAQTGQYTVCVDVIEIGDGGEICNKAKMCTSFFITCTGDPLPVCCKDTLGFNQHFVSNMSYIKDGCLVCFPINAADSCDLISVDFGDLSNPVVFDGDSICHSFAEKGIYDVCISTERYDPNDICLAKDTCISVSVSCDPNELCKLTDIKVPNGLTPNGDNINDVLRIIKPAACRQIEISIYNRWGQLVWAQADYDNTWDGRSLNGNVLPDGTYYLILSLPAPGTEIRSFKTFIDIRTK